MLYDGHGNQILTDFNGTEIIKHNLWGGGVLVDGHNWNSSNKNIAFEKDETKYVTYAKLNAGEPYLFVAPGYMMITDILPTPEEVTQGGRWVDILGEHIVWRGLTQNFFTGSPYAYTPDKDVYVIAALNRGTPMIVWSPDVTGDINPSLLHNGSFNASFINRLETVEVSEPFAKTVAAAQNVNRIYDSTLHTRWIGDSIMNAGTNAGWDNCYRTLACNALGSYSTFHAVNGTCMTDGCGMDWSSGKTGYTGFVESDATFVSGSNTTGFADASYIYKWLDLCVLALGTNDFGNAAPLGTIDDTGTDTFYGAFKAFLTYFQTRKPNLPILVIMPFKRENWATKNEQGLILTDYIQAMYNVCRQFRHIYILDLWSAFYLNSDDAAAKSKYFLDYVHPSANAHMCIAQAVIEKIKQICVMEGVSK